MMASTLTRLRLHYIGTIRVSRLVTPLITLIFLFIIYRLMKSPTYGVVRSKGSSTQHKMHREEIDQYLDALQDTRPQQCRIDYHRTILENKKSVSILVNFHEDEIYNLKLTLSSIVQNTPGDLISEIVVLDDGTENMDIRQHAAEFLLGEQFKKIRPFRSSQKHGRGNTRFKASRVAQSEILVFVASSVVVNVGWLEPLMLALVEKEERIVVPHSDNFLSEKRFFKMDDTLVNTFSWPLSTIYKESSEENHKYLKNPVMRGDVVAVTKDYLDSIGNYDETMGGEGADDFELSLRTWLCGGQVLVSLCSRIATHSALKPIDVTGEDTIRRISELWMDDYKDIVYKQTGLEHSKLYAENPSFKTRQGFLKDKLQCKPFEWYLRTVARDTLAPSDTMQQYGKLKAMSAYCVRSVSDKNVDVDLVLCRPYMYDQAMMFEFDQKGRIRKGDKCLMAPGVSSRVMLTDCQEQNKLQVWKHTSGRFTIDSFPGACLSHVTQNDDAHSHVHIIQLSKCKNPDDPKQTWTFIRY